jgi:hypothetical protein
LNKTPFIVLLVFCLGVLLYACKTFTEENLKSSVWGEDTTSPKVSATNSAITDRAQSDSHKPKAQHKLEPKRKSKLGPSARSKIVDRKSIGGHDISGKPNYDLIVEVAVKRAESLGSVKAMRICYQPTDEEWSIALYKEIGGLIHVKQFIWDDQANKLRPFLILKSFPRNKLTSEIHKLPPTKYCEIVTLRSKKR